MRPLCKFELPEVMDECAILKATTIANDDDPYGYREASVRQVKQFAQNYFVDEFQEY